MPRRTESWHDSGIPRKGEPTKAKSGAVAMSHLASEPVGQSVLFAVATHGLVGSNSAKKPAVT